MKAMQCQRCGKTVQVPPTKEKGFRFCSKECRHAACNTLKTCLNCGKQYMVHNSRAAEGKGNYCSKACLESHTGSGWEERTCKVCGEPFQSRKGKIHGWLTCSKACANAAKALASTKRIYKKLGPKPVDQTQKVAVACDYCGKVHYRYPSRIYPTNFCSPECRNKGNANNRIGKIISSEMVDCKECGKPFKAYKSRVKDGLTKFCSAECWHKWDAKQKSNPEHIKQMMSKMESLKGGSGIERKVESWLNERKIDHERQKQIGEFVVDFVVGNIAIEVNGCYWHGCKHCYPSPNETQKKRRRRDVILLRTLNAAGYKVVFIWEHDVKKGNFSAIEKLLNLPIANF